MALLLLAATLRFVGLSWGLRHQPDWDERAFVEAAQLMVWYGDFNHRFYEYPGLLIDLLALALVLVPRSVATGPGAYLVARAVVATFSVASVALAYRLAVRLIDRRAALVAALFMALSPLEIWTTHMLRPDIVLGTFVLASLLAFDRVGPRLRNDLWAGVALGATAAVKFTGALLLPAYLLARWLRPGSRWQGTAVAGLAALAVWVLTTPYAVLTPASFFGGVVINWTYHYRGGGMAPRFLEIASFYLRTLAGGVGLVGVPLAALGLLAARRHWRAWLPGLSYAAVLVGVLSTAEARWARLVVSALGVVAVLAALGFAVVARRWPRAGVLLALAIAAVLLPKAIENTRSFLQPRTMDRALDWIEANVPAGAHVLTDMPELGIDRRRFEVLRAAHPGWYERRWAASMDCVVLSGRIPPSWLSVMDVALRVEPEQSHLGPPISILRPRGAVPEQMTPSLAWLTTSVQDTRLAALVDGNLETYWETERAEPGSWIEVDFPQPRIVSGLELHLGQRWRGAPRRLAILTRAEGKGWQRERTFAGRPSYRKQALAGKSVSRVLLFAPQRVEAIRLVLETSRPRPWSIAELSIATRSEPVGQTQETRGDSRPSPFP